MQKPSQLSGSLIWPGKQAFRQIETYSGFTLNPYGVAASLCLNFIHYNIIRYIIPPV
ncbi:hypothetical protein EIKCOROL_02306 [Eikenella corrodens ATCC 23834]|uniref:Uncharacterized protein n=1 Tax=Eikenella corrodens ATCC 23834 TaxID=546274 RepID=C0DY44_EIKCO|nr:hypothetical protein EIKCOROL_02306 [Eikenella corrodens ATCC 23834]